MKQSMWCVLLTMALCISLMTACSSGSGGSSGEVAAENEPSILEAAGDPVAQQPDTVEESGKEGAQVQTDEPGQGGPNALVVFFSRHGNSLDGVDAVASASLSSDDATVLADMIAENTGADLFQIITVDPYPIEYNDCTEVATVELEEDARPALANTVENMDQYDVVYLGYPIWWGTIPMPVATFLEEYDFSGKTVVPFCTHESSGLGQSVEHIASLLPDVTVLEGFAVRGNNAAVAQDDLTQWMQNLGLTD